MASHRSERVAAPRVQILCNGSHALMIDEAGSGFSRWRNLAVTRWREDPVGDGWGCYVLLRDESDGRVWSATTQPFGSDASDHAAHLTPAHVAIVHRRAALSSTLEVAVAADRDLELRRVTLGNHGAQARDISLTSYTELVLGDAAADAAHPAFSKLFVQTDWIPESGVLLATRRRRTPQEPEIWCAHAASVDGCTRTSDEFETDRLRFLGRGRGLRSAQSMQPGAALSNTCGSVLDPVFSLRRRVRLEPGATVRVTFWTAVADSRAAVLALMHGVGESGAGDRALAGARDRVQAELARLGLDAARADHASRLSGALLNADAALRADPAAIARGAGGAPVLWSCGISGDRPIVLVRVAGESDLACVDELLRMQRYWQAQRLGVDVVMLGAGDAAVQAALEQRTARHNGLLAADASVAAKAFALRDAQIDTALRDGLATAARIVFDAGHGLPDHAQESDHHPARARAAPSTSRAQVETSAPTSAAREFDNGLGGFVDDGRAYAITLTGGCCTPMPWINVIANRDFGFLVSAEGGGYTWSINSQQNPLTPWPNDPVSDTPHEVIYLRDADDGTLWSATALPIRVPDARYRVEHGKGYSCFRTDAQGIDLELLQFVPTTDPVKLSRLRLHNRGTRTRTLSITGYVAWALDANGTAPAPYVVTSRDADSGALFARNAWRAQFAARVAFIDLGGRQHACTGDRMEFLGPFGSVEAPAALVRAGELSGRVGAGLHPCGVLQTRVALAPDERVELVFVLGEAPSEDAARTLIRAYRNADLDACLQAVREQWDDVLDTVQVHTPDRALDILLNDWLLYQALGCRVWARTAYYQASGAYGFRDQLQDVMALCVARPDIAREQLLRASARQFVAGDVQHWWLPPGGKGVRTRVSDDRLWLPYVAAHYVATTHDVSVLDERVAFLDGPALETGQADAFFQPTVSAAQASLYEHCARAIDASLALGAHGLPLMGTGDWNDGMNHVGAQGRGESVWLGWFLLATIDAFAPLAAARAERTRANAWHVHATALRTALDGEAGWDGAWYRRGYYDDGTPLGSHASDECRIDAIAQSWSVLADTANRDHAQQAMESVDRLLLDRTDQIALLFAPPFDHAREDPGYIKGYPPGIRENGGQYTHGAIWSIFALTRLGHGDRAGDLFTMLNPIRHSLDAAALARYRVEPYVACADVYSVAPHAGRGGWTWYTGSAGWLYRAGLEAMLGFRLQGTQLLLDPCVPAAWPGYSLVYRRRGGQGMLTCYEIAVDNPAHAQRGVRHVELDGAPLAADPGGAARIPLVDDGRRHVVRVTMG